MVGIECFIKQDITSPLAQETIRRLKKLQETGITDE